MPERANRTEPPFFLSYNPTQADRTFEQAAARGFFCVEATMQDFAKQLYKSKAWQHCRASYLKQVGGLCERCLARGIYKPGEIVHHRIHLTPDNVNDPSVTLNPDNLELLCRDCHAIAHKPEKRFNVDEMGRVIPME